MMNTVKAFALAEANKDKTPKVFDWDKAARLIIQAGATEATAGLAGDMEWTSGPIFSGGEIDEDGYTYLESKWATPVLVLDGGEEVECFVMGNKTEGNAKTKWPDSARQIITYQIDSNTTNPERK